MEEGNLEIKTFKADSEEKLEEKLEDFHTKHPHIKVQSTTHRVGYNKQGGKRHDYAMFYLT